MTQIAAPASDNHSAVWKARYKVEKYDADGALYETLEREDNLLMYGGASNLIECLIGNGSSTSSESLTYFDNTNAYIGVGDSTTAAAATQTDLQAASNKLRNGMNSTYPLHTDGTSSAAASFTMQATFASADANFAWAEWGIFNASSGGRMLSRKVDALGTKSSGSSWVFTVTLSLA